MSAKKTIPLTFFTDPGHGWLRVDPKLIMEFDLADKISGFSYQDLRWVYLEEDLDAGVFLKAAESKYSFDITEIHRDSESPIRSLPSYGPRA